MNSTSPSSADAFRSRFLERNLLDPLLEEDRELYVEAAIGSLQGRVAAILEKLRADHGITKQQLATRAGKQRSYISAVLSGSQNLTLESLVRISIALEHLPRITLQPAQNQGARVWRQNDRGAFCMHPLPQVHPGLQEIA